MKTYKESLEEFEQRYLIKLMKQAEGKKIEASLISGISRMQLDRMLKRHNVVVEEYKNATE